MKAAYADNFVTAYCGDALEVMRGLPAGSVHCCVTSPPYWGLRDYGQDGQLGLERTPDEYVGRMVEYFREVKRLLRKDGTLWLNLGDSYASGGRGGNPVEKSGLEGGTKSQEASKESRHNVPPGLKAKDMVGIPWRVAFALQADGWYLRSEIIWNKPNPMPESVTDRPTKSHETIFLLSRSPRYYYDAEAIKETGTGNAHDTDDKVPQGWDTGPGGHAAKAGPYRTFGKHSKTPAQSAGRRIVENVKRKRLEAGDHDSPFGKTRNKRSVWTVATQPYPGAHYATFPPKLILPCILAGTSELGCCPRCDAPWRRLIESKANYEKREPAQVPGNRADKVDSTGWKPPTVTDHGWQAGCKCGAEPEPCVVLDPFAGSGTTGQVARETGRKAILIELNPEDIELRMKERFKQELLPL